MNGNLTASFQSAFFTTRDVPRCRSGREFKQRFKVITAIAEKELWKKQGK